MKKIIQLSWVIGIIFCSITNTIGQVLTPYLNLETAVYIESANAINSKNLESSPIFYENGIVFVYARDKSKFLDEKIGLPFFELMYSNIGPDGQPRRAVSFSSNIRTNFHEGPSSFSNNFNEIFFTRSNSRKGKEIEGGDKKVNLNILSATKGLEDWENIELLPFCNDAFSVCHPAVSADGSFMVFSSNMPGGVGGMDLYIIERKGGNWQVPVNLGTDINTAGNEIFPTLQQNDIIFFSSDGHKGYGGLDVFAAQKKGAVFGNMMSLPIPFNSRKDDLGLIVDVTGKYGLLASSRKGSKGKDDIYILKMDENLFLEKNEEEIVKIEEIEEIKEIEENTEVGEIICIDVFGKIKGLNSDQVISDVLVHVRNNCGHDEVMTFSDQSGMYDYCLPVDCYYDVSISKEGYETETFNFSPNPENNPVWHIFLKEKVKAKPIVSPVFTEENLAEGKIIVLENIYYDFNKSAIQKGAAEELNELASIMKQYPSMEIELSSHTDSRGLSAYNLELSERRAFSAKDFLVAHGIAAKRIFISAKGENEIRNGCVDGVPCSEEQHRHNRRTEVKVLKIDANVKFQ